MRKLAVLVIFSTLIAICYSLHVKSCSSSIKTPKNVDIKGCEKSPCKIKKGTNLYAEILFTTSEATKTLKPQLTARVMGMKIPLNLPAEHQNGCAHLKDAQCPLKANQDVLYYVQMPVLKTYPSMKTEIEVNLLGDNLKPVSCFKVEGQLV